MSKRPSLVFQVKKVMDRAYQEGFGTKRHSDKANAIHNDKNLNYYSNSKLYSHNSYKTDKQQAITFVKFCRAEFKIKYLHEIKPEMFTSYIERGMATKDEKFKKITAEKYANAAKKLQACYNKQNNTNYIFVNTDYRKYIRGISEIARQKMPREVHDKIIELADKAEYINQNCHNGKAFRISRTLGLRVQEITNLRLKDFKLDKQGQVQEVYIHKSKGGRCRTIKIDRINPRYRPNIQQVYDYFKTRIKQDQRLFINKKQSYETTFRRYRESITSSKYNQCNLHSMRKEFAQDYYQLRLSEGMSDLDARKELTEALGHNRLEVLGSYLK